MKAPEERSQAPRKRINLTALILAAFIILYLVQTCSFIFADRAPKDTDNHFPRSYAYYERLILKDSKADLSVVAFPPLVYSITLIHYALLGVSMETARLSLLVFSVIFILAMFGIGREFGGDTGGLLTAFLAASSPHVLTLSSLYLLDFPQTAVTALAFYCLLKSKGFTDRRNSLIFGFVLAASFLVKWSVSFFMILPVLWFLYPVITGNLKNRKVLSYFIFPVLSSLGGLAYYFLNPVNGLLAYRHLAVYVFFVIIPVAVSLFLLFRNEKERRDDEIYQGSPGQALVNFTLASAVVMVFVLPWYIWTADVLKRKYLFDVESLRIPSVIFIHYLKVLMSQFGFAFYLLIIGTVYIIRTKEDRERLLLLPLNVLFVLLIMLKVGFPVNRYILSLIIFSAPIGCLWVLRTGKARKPLIFVIILISLLSILARPLNFKENFLFRKVPHYVSFEKNRGTNYAIKGNVSDLIRPSLFLPPAPDGERYPIDGLVSYMKGTEKGAWKPFIMIYLDEGKISPSKFQGEYIQEVSFGKGKRVDPIYRWKYSQIKDRMKGGSEGDDLLKKISSCEEILFIHEKGADLSDVIEDFRKFLYVDNSTRKTFPAGDDLEVTVVRFGQTEEGETAD